MSSSTSPRTAARAVYDLPHVRKLVFSCLERVDLQSFLRADKAFGQEIRRELYDTMKLRDLAGPDWKDIFPPGVCTAVSTIEVEETDHRRFSLQRWLTEPLPSDHPSKGISLRMPHALRYDPKIFNLMIPRLRELCPNARRIVIGNTTHGYIVHCHTGAADEGRVEIFTPFQYSLNRDDPDKTSIPPPSPGYEMTTRINLRLSENRGVDQTRLNAWRSALLDPTRSVMPLHLVDFGALPISLDDCAQLYQLQNASGASDRMQQIEAGSALPWSIGEFGTFASIASTSLHKLRLGTSAHRTSIDELPQLIDIIRQHLPNLRSLSIGIADSDGAETAFGPLLSSDCLATMGRLTELKIHHLPGLYPFNAIRLLYCLCDWQASLCTNEEQYILVYLQRLSPQQKGFMATVNMQDLGVTAFRDLFRLRYRNDGSPMSLAGFRLGYKEHQ